MYLILELNHNKKIQALNVQNDFSDIALAESKLWYMQVTFMLNYEIWFVLEPACTTTMAHVQKESTWLAETTTRKEWHKKGRRKEEEIVLFIITAFISTYTVLVGINFLILKFKKLNMKQLLLTRLFVNFYYLIKHLTKLA